MAGKSKRIEVLQIEEIVTLKKKRTVGQRDNTAGKAWLL